MSADLKEEFRKVGVIHLVVLSGYNISVIADGVLKFLAWFPLSALLRTLISAGAIILFSIMTGGSSTIVRAAIMGILLLFARSTGKIYQALTALFVAAFFMAIINPKILRFDTSFQLSFLATLSLIVFLPRIERYFLWFPNKFKLRETFLSTISTQIFVLPLLMASSGYISLVSLPANILILGFVPLTMFFGFVTGLAGFLSGIASQIFSYPTYWLLSWELGIVNFFSKFSFAIFQISNTSIWVTALLYILIAFFVLYLYSRESHEKKV